MVAMRLTIGCDEDGVWFAILEIRGDLVATQAESRLGLAINFVKAVFAYLTAKLECWLRREPFYVPVEQVTEELRD